MATKRRSLPKDPQTETPVLPTGVKLIQTFRGHKDWIGRIAWSPDGRMLASPSADRTVRLWDAGTGECLQTLAAHAGAAYATAFHPLGHILASAGKDQTVKLWEVASGKLLRSLEEHLGSVNGVAFDPSGRTLVSASNDQTVKLWDADSGRLLRSFEGHQGWVYDVAFDPTGRKLASVSFDRTAKLWDSGSGLVLRSFRHSNVVLNAAFDPNDSTLAFVGPDETVKIWDPESGEILRSYEGHTGTVKSVCFAPDGRLLGSKGGSGDNTIRLWRGDTGAHVWTIPEPSNSKWPPSLAFHPQRPFLATVGSDIGTPQDQADRIIHLWELDIDLLLEQGAAPEVSYTSAKIVLVGDSGVGKTGLGWRLAHGEFKEHASTHGQQLWLLDELSTRRPDGTRCEGVLWDLAGQPDYRLIHALFLDDADLALVLFDPTDSRDPLHGVEFWLKQLEGDPKILLVAARCDRGTATLTRDELETFCRQRGLAGYLDTSAKDGDGVAELIERMQALIPWQDKPATVTTTTFKRIKDYVLELKEDASETQVIVRSEELRQRLEAIDADWQFTDAEMLTAVGHLENHGYVKRLRTSRGETRILLLPELVNNLAASFVLEARRNPKGLGSLEEKRLLAGEYGFRELDDLSDEERDVLLDSAALMFLEHNVCFRETSPLTSTRYLVFPELINLKRPIAEDEKPTEDGVSYTVTGAVENVYASLVVLLGYTQTFTRTNQWKNQARYEVGSGLVCGFRLEAESAGELELVLYFGDDVGAPVRTLFQGLFESILARRNLTVHRYPPVACTNGHPLSRDVVRERLQDGADVAFCPRCGEKTSLPKVDKPIQLTRKQQAKVEAQRRVADMRSRFEQAVFRVRTYVEQEEIKPPECFISYAWGEDEHERWVERQLATDLHKAGVDVLLDRWDNQRVGKSVIRFVDRIAECDRVVVVGTPLYKQKYDNEDDLGGFVVAAEGDLIGQRLTGSEAEKESVLPVLLAGSEKSSFPPMLRRRVHADFRDEQAYFTTAFDLILSLYEIDSRDQAVADLRESLREPYGSMG